MSQSGRIRLAANILVETWIEFGSSFPVDYDSVWRTKEWLHDCADRLDKETA